MRVLAVTPWFPSAASAGAGIFNLRDAELLAEDHDVTVLHLIAPRLLLDDEPAAETLDSGIVVHRIAYDLRSPNLLWRARKRIRELLPAADLVHTMAFPALLPTRLARPRVPWVHTEHWTGLVKPAPTLHARAGAFFLRRDLAQPDELIAVSRYFADIIDRHRDRPSRVIANFVRITDAEVDDRRAESRRLRLISAANLVPWKGPLEAVEAVAELRARGWDATLEWAGVGPLEESVREAAASAGIADAVTLLNYLPTEQLSKFLLAADVFVLPTEVETFGVAIAEAFGHGLPVVTSGFGGHLEFLPTEASRVVAERTGRALADAVEQLVRADGGWSAEQIVQYARQTFGNDARRQAYADAYRTAKQGYAVRHGG